MEVLSSPKHYISPMRSQLRNESRILAARRNINPLLKLTSSVGLKRSFELFTDENVDAPVCSLKKKQRSALGESNINIYCDEHSSGNEDGAPHKKNIPKENKTLSSVDPLKKPSSLSKVKNANVGKKLGKKTEMKSVKKSSPTSSSNKRANAKKSTDSTVRRSVLLQNAMLALERARKVHARPANPAAQTVTKVAACFVIYEDSPSEELHNIMEHSTGMLRIRDNANEDSELQTIKENIHPDAMSKILAGAAIKSINTRDGTFKTEAQDVEASAKSGNVVRECLRELDLAQFVPTAEEEQPVPAPVLKTGDAPGLNGGAPFEVYEDEGREDDDKEN